MKIISIEFYLDGGTAKICADNGIWYLDRRLFTKTKNKIYDAYPDEENAHLVDEDLFIKEMIGALRIFVKENIGKNRFHPEGVNGIIDALET